MPRPNPTRSTLRLLERFESPNVTFQDPNHLWPIVWETARGMWVHTADGRRYLDMTAAFGVAAAGHAHPSVVGAAHQQAQRLLHAMGDVHPHRPKAHLCQTLSQLTFQRWSAGRLSGKTILGNSGFEAVEAALKTAFLLTNRPRVLAFEGAYHGLGYGALNATHRPHFRNPFRPQLAEFASFLPFPEAEPPAPRRTANPSQSAFIRLLRQTLAREKPGAILVEPVQVRGGIRIPPPWLLPALRSAATEHGALLILDEIYTGFGRTGAWFACEHTRTRPDLICLGKALTGGFPLSACVGESTLMDRAWPRSNGEAIHTSTFLGHPVGCAMALAQIRVLQRQRLIQHSRLRGRSLHRALLALLPLLPPGCAQVRSCGLTVGLEIWKPNLAPDPATVLHLVHRALARGLILLPEGDPGNVLAFTPPLIAADHHLNRAVRILRSGLESLLP